jgi:hypothetical protein
VNTAFNKSKRQTHYGGHVFAKTKSQQNSAKLHAGVCGVNTAYSKNNL